DLRGRPHHRVGGPPLLRQLGRSEEGHHPHPRRQEGQHGRLSTMGNPEGVPQTPPIPTPTGCGPREILPQPVGPLAASVKGTPQGVDFLAPFAYLTTDGRDGSMERGGRRGALPPPASGKIVSHDGAASGPKPRAGCAGPDPG